MVYAVRGAQRPMTARICSPSNRKAARDHELAYALSVPEFRVKALPWITGFDIAWS
jgi:hypothetical protein